MKITVANICQSCKTCLYRINLLVYLLQVFHFTHRFVLDFDSWILPYESIAVQNGKRKNLLQFFRYTSSYLGRVKVSCQKDLEVFAFCHYSIINFSFWEVPPFVVTSVNNIRSRFRYK